MTETSNSNDTAMEQLLAQMNQQQAEMQALRDKLAEQEARLNQLNQAVVEPVSPTPLTLPTATSSRRRMLKKMGAVAAGLAVAGAVGSAIGSANPAYADDGKNHEKLTPEPPGRNADGGNMIIGATNNSTARTFLANDGTGTRVLLVSSSGSTLGAFPSAIAGAGLTTNAPSGVYGFTNQSGGFGLVGSGQGAGTIGGSFFGGQANIIINPGGAAPSTRSDAHTVGEIISDTNGDLWYCTVSGTPGTWRKLQGPATSGALHVLPSADRFLDSRSFVQSGDTLGTIPAGSSRSYLIGGGTGQNSATVPFGALAVVGNVTAFNGPSASGGNYLKLYSNAVSEPPVASVNFNSTNPVGNFFVCAISTSTGRIRVTALKEATVIIDITGYYL